MIEDAKHQRAYVYNELQYAKQEAYIIGRQDAHRETAQLVKPGDRDPIIQLSKIWQNKAKEYFPTE